MAEQPEGKEYTDTSVIAVIKNRVYHKLKNRV